MLGKFGTFFLFFSFFREIFLMKITTGNLFLLFFYMKKQLHVGEIIKKSSEKVFFCKIYRHVRHSLILICTLMSSMGKIDQHFEKWFKKYHSFNRWSWSNLHIGVLWGKQKKFSSKFRKSSQQVNHFWKSKFTLKLLIGEIENFSQKMIDFDSILR